MFDKFLKRNKKQKSLIHHFIFIESPIEVVWEQLINWPQASWWPEESAVRFSDESSGPFETGANHLQHIKFGMRFKWRAEVNNLTRHKILYRQIAKGFLSGDEVIEIEERYNGTKFNYHLNYRIKNPVMLLLWVLFLKRKFNASMVAVLTAMRDYCQAQKRI